MFQFKQAEGADTLLRQPFRHGTLTEPAARGVSIAFGADNQGTLCRMAAGSIGEYQTIE